MTDPGSLPRQSTVAGSGQGWRGLSSIAQIQDALDDAIDDWHNGAGMPNEPLHEYLGMTWDDYSSWVETGVLP